MAFTDINSEDRLIQATFADLDEEQLALFDRLKTYKISKAALERPKQSGRELLAALRELIAAKKVYRFIWQQSVRGWFEARAS